LRQDFCPAPIRTAKQAFVYIGLGIRRVSLHEIQQITFMDKQGSPWTKCMLVRGIDRLLILSISLLYKSYFPPAVHYKSSNNTLSIAPIVFARNPLGKVLGVPTLLAHTDGDWYNNHFPTLHLKLPTRPLPRTVIEASCFFWYVHSLSEYATSYRQP